MEKKMAKQKPTKKEIETVVSGIINHLKFIEQKVNAIDNLFGLYLRWKEEQEEFNKFVESTVKEATESNVEKEPGEAK